MMKNVTLIRSTPSVLIGPDGERIEFFERFMRNLYKHELSKNTIDAYQYGGAGFLDYLIECQCFLSPYPVDIYELEKYIDLYPEYLAHGVRSRNPEIKEISERLGHNPLKKKSCTNRIAAANKMIELNNKWGREIRKLDELTNNNGHLISLEITDRDQRGFYEREAISRNSIISGNIQKHAHIKGIESAGALIDRGHDCDTTFFGKDFPFEMINPVLNRTENLRNRCLFAYLAASGLRISEALGTQTPLIDMKKREVRIIDPYNLRKSENYPDHLKLPWKGRSTAIVFMFEPLKSIFFEALADYLKKRPFTTHDYLFTYEGNFQYGEPMYFGLESSSLYGTLNDAFAHSQSLTKQDYPELANKRRYSIHSLRHFYGIYLSNYLWIDGRPEPGLLIEEVQICMGHKSIKSTQIYARKKADLIAIKFAAADQIVMDGNLELNITEIIASNLELLAKNIRCKPSEAPAWLTSLTYP
ncbi:tyrosine-type recombinase/integrase [Pseudomonas aeruginosa]|uniref:tyrosine-type recombinase/integrase n=1 Tax=Pseudomonas aeruginosa TaxID=287 RepID=UPI0015721DF1|nr:site-specific integrase [Pseudomonas aeruginosa]NTS89704.1 site-specific integrase [Pseudomonas aeruginosa]